MKIKHTKHCLEMNKILKNIPCKIYYAGIFLVVMMFLVLFFINHFIQYERTIKFPIQIIIQKSSCQAKILVDSSYINYFHKEYIPNNKFTPLSPISLYEIEYRHTQNRSYNNA